MEVIFKGFIEDVRNEKCSDTQIPALLHILTVALVPFARFYAEKSDCEKTHYDNLVGFEGAKKYGVEEFELTIEKTGSDKDFDHFSGQFICDGKNLKALAKIKKDQILPNSRG